MLLVTHIIRFIEPSLPWEGKRILCTEKLMTFEMEKRDAYRLRDASYKEAENERFSFGS